MKTLTLSPKKSAQPSGLDSFNIALRKLKEEFHRTGRFDDANVKLDEIIKLLVIKYFDLKNHKDSLSINHLRSVAKKQFGSETQIANAMQSVFSKVANSREFINPDGSNVFGANPHLNIQSVDNGFATRILDIFNEISWNSDSSVDLLNEAFGHFVRDNFRNHKEDAQYMTPIEVVDAMIDLALHDIGNQTEKDFIVMDPTCGVGSFLTRAKEKMGSRGKKAQFIGQDKVDRMVRMSKVNLLLADLDPHKINQGNSITGPSSLDNYAESVDLIITNPPFGAEFTIEELGENLKNFEILPKIIEQIQTHTINSELLLLDRSLKLLKPGGRLLIVVPDGVVSAGGIYEIYRNFILKNYSPRAIIDLPSVTFAQAGTRTRCSVVYIEKPKAMVMQKPIFMAVIDDIGYEVKEKLGSPVKVFSGENELSLIKSHYAKISKSKGPQVIAHKPSSVAYPADKLINGKWNANFYRAERINAIKEFDNITGNRFTAKTLADVSRFVTRERERVLVSDTVKCISVLHVNEDSTLKVDEVMTYKPSGPGIRCYPGEILFSKINPRIPRVIVVTNLGKYELICSTEFEIIKPIDEKYTYMLKTILLSDLVQKQIQALTSGTSSSHNRIKDAELKHVRVLWPIKGSQTERKMLNLGSQIKKEESTRYESAAKIRDAKISMNSLFSV